MALSILLMLSLAFACTNRVVNLQPAVTASSRDKTADYGVQARVIFDVYGSDILHDIPTVKWTYNPTRVSWDPSDSVTITWSTDVPSTSQVEFGTSSQYGAKTDVDTNLVTKHSVSLGKLDKAVIYHYRVISKIPNRPETVSDDNTYGWLALLVNAIPNVAPYWGLGEVTNKMPPAYFSTMDAKSLQKWLEKAFNCYGPETNPNRDVLFTGLDFSVLANIVTNNNQDIWQYVGERQQSVYHQLLNAGPSDGVTIYKLYNEGTIIKTNTECIGIDLAISHFDGAITSKFAQVLDALFITHGDNDHFDIGLINEMKQLGKPVINAPDDDSKPIGSLNASGSIKNIKWSAFRGAHEDGGFSGFFTFQAGGKTILHSGDDVEKWEQFLDTPYSKNIDVFICKNIAEYGTAKSILEKMNPKYVIPQHALEISIAHGISNAIGSDAGIRLYSLVPKTTTVQLLNWGESITLR